MRTIDVTTEDRHTLRAEDDGAGETILVVPPGGSDAAVWRGVTHYLAEKFRSSYCNGESTSPTR